jgi:hypothetical protein
MAANPGRPTDRELPAASSLSTASPDLSQRPRSRPADNRSTVVAVLAVIYLIWLALLVWLAFFG